MPLILAPLLLGAASAAPADRQPATAKPAPPVAAVRPPGDEHDERAGEPAPAQAGQQQPDGDEADAQPDSTIVVTARRLDTARTRIDAWLGATVYSLTNEAVENRPGGETGSVADVLAQAPGAALSGKTLTIRGSAANQVRINNVIVPEALSDPADQLSSRLVETTRLITGTLPAQFGFAPAGVISVTTKNGLYQHGGQAELFAGSDGMIEPALEWSGSLSATSLFASGDLERSRSTLADALGNSARERTNGIGGLGFADHVIDQSNRVSMIVGGSRKRRSIGATSLGPGVEVNGDAFGVGTFQHSDNSFTVQASVFYGAASDRASFGVTTRERRTSVGTQVDASATLGTAHTLRFGLLATRSRATELEPGGNRYTASRTSAALYAQDEWALGPTLTFNPGARAEWLRGFGSAATIEPRASLVWKPGDGWTAHLGYARYASAPPLGEEPRGMRLRDERDDYLDAGVQKKVGAFTFGLDGYWRSARDYIAEHRTAGSALARAFAFSRARIKGVEASATYAHGPTTAWANLALQSAKGTGIVGGEPLFSPAIIVAASRGFVPVAGARPVIASAGLVQHLGRLSLGGDLLVSSGAVRTADSASPNGLRHSPYAVLGLAAVYHLRIAGRPADLRLDLSNLTDTHYLTNDAASLEGGWSRQGRGRAITIGIEQGF